MHDTDYVTKYEIQTSLDKKSWVTYKENGTNKVNRHELINIKYARVPIKMHEMYRDLD